MGHPGMCLWSTSLPEDPQPPAAETTLPRDAGTTYPRLRKAESYEKSRGMLREDREAENDSVVNLGKNFGDVGIF